MRRLYLEDVRFQIGRSKTCPTIYRTNKDLLDLYIGEYDFMTCGDCNDDHLTYFSSVPDIHEWLHNGLPAWLYQGCLFDEHAPRWRFW